MDREHAKKGKNALMAITEVMAMEKVNAKLTY